MDKRGKKLKEVLQSQKREINADEVWMNISDRLPQRKSRRPAVWWFLLLLIPLGVGVYFLTDVAPSEKLAPSPLRDAVVLESGTNKERDDVDLAKQSNKPTDLKEEAARDISIRSAEMTVLNGRGVVERMINKSAINADHLDELKELQEGRAKIEVVAEEKEPEKSIYLETFHQENTKSPNTGDDIAFIKSKISGGPARLPIDISLLNVENSTKQIESSALTSPVSRQSQRFALVLAAGSNRSLGSVEGIDDFEEGLYGTSINTGIEYDVKRRWALKLGLAYHTNVSRYQSKEEEYLIENNEGIDEILIDAHGIQTSNKGSVKAVSVLQNDIRWHRRHQVLDIELILRKNIPLSYKWKAGIDLGLAYNLLTSSKGFGYEVEDGAEHIVKFNSDPGYFLKRTGLKPILGGELAYRVGGVEILAQGNYQWIMNPINTQSNNYKLKHSQTGIQLGMRYYLNGNKN